MKPYFCGMKRLGVFLVLILSISAGYLYQTYLCIDFAINQEDIAAEFCENKDEPVLQCNGKCHRAKMLQKVDNPSEKDTPGTIKRLAVPDLFIPAEGESAEVELVSEFKLIRLELFYTIGGVSDQELPPPERIG